MSAEHLSRADLRSLPSRRGERRSGRVFPELSAKEAEAGEQSSGSAPSRRVSRKRFVVAAAVLAPLFIAQIREAAGINISSASESGPTPIELPIPSGIAGEVRKFEATIKAINREPGIAISSVTPTATEIQQEQGVGIFTQQEILQRYGVEIPSSPQSQYQAGKAFIERSASEISPIRIKEEGKTATLTTYELSILKEAISKIPSPDSLAQLILPYRYESLSDTYEVPQAYFWGRLWKHHLKRGALPSVGSPEGKFDERSAIILFLPSDFDPQKKLELSPILESVNKDATISDNLLFGQVEEIPRTTHGEKLKQTIIHEFGHGVVDQVRYRLYGSYDEYLSEYRFSLCGFENIEPDNPIFKTFAVVNGWRLVSSKEILEACVPDWREDPQLANSELAWGWKRDSDVWGDPLRLRISYLASISNIEETFAEFWMASLLYPQLLTPDEKIYFDNIHHGLATDPENFFEEIIKNPNLLLKGTSFE